MKKKILAVFVACMICVGVVGESSMNVFAEETNTESMQTEPQTIIIRGEDNIRKYQEAMGQPYDPDVIEIYRTIYDDDSKNEIDTLLGNDFYIKNKTVSTATNYKKIIKQYNRPAGKVTLSETVSISNTYSATGGISSDVLSAELGFSVTKSSKFKVSWSNTYSYPITIKVHPIYETYKGELWEDDVFKDEKVGSFTVKKAIGDEITVKRR